jgi:hypothetical protein
MELKDVKTKDRFNVRLDDTVVVRMRDGVKVRLHPNFIQLTVKPGEMFEGHTTVGTRKLRRLT